MKKLSLKVEHLVVESFETAPTVTRRGTVVGEQHPSDVHTRCMVYTCYYTCAPFNCYTDPPNNTCQNTCNEYVFTCTGNGGGGTDWTECDCGPTTNETGYTDYGCGENTA